MSPFVLAFRHITFIWLVENFNLDTQIIISNDHICFTVSYKTISNTFHNNGREEIPDYPPKATNLLRSGYNDRKRRTKREEREADTESEEETDWSSSSVLATTNHQDHEPPRTGGIVCTVVVRGHVNNEHVRCTYTG